MKTLVLAAGYATRLYPLTKDRPKPLLEISGRPVLEHLLAQIEKVDPSGTRYIVTNHKFYSQFGKWKALYRTSGSIVLLDDGSTDESNRLGAVGDMSFCIQHQNIAEDLLVVAGDNLFDMDLAPFLRFSQEKSPFCSVMLYDVKDFALARHYGIVGLDGDQRVVSFEEKPKSPSSTLSAMGVYYFPKKALGQIAAFLLEGSPQDAPGFFIRWLYQRETVYGYPCEGLWYDIGDLESYRRASQVFEGREEKR